MPGNWSCMTSQIYSAQATKLHYSQFKYTLIVSWEYIGVQGSVTEPLKIARAVWGRVSTGHSTRTLLHKNSKR